MPFNRQMPNINIPIVDTRDKYLPQAVANMGEGLGRMAGVYYGKKWENQRKEAEAAKKLEADRVAAEKARAGLQSMVPNIPSTQTGFSGHTVLDNPAQGGFQMVSKPTGKLEPAMTIPSGFTPETYNSAGKEAVQEALKRLFNPEQPKPFTLKEGETQYSGIGDVIAERPKQPEYGFKPGQTREINLDDKTQTNEYQGMSPEGKPIWQNLGIANRFKSEQPPDRSMKLLIEDNAGNQKSIVLQPGQSVPAGWHKVESNQGFDLSNLFPEETPPQPPPPEPEQQPQGGFLKRLLGGDEQQHSGQYKKYSGLKVIK